jgi:predicted phosphoribosyltransferase
MAKKKQAEIKRRLKTYREDASTPQIAGRRVIVVDDGVATGSTLKAALRSLRNRSAKTVTVAVPVGPADTIRELQREADHVICLSTPDPFYAIGQFYDDFNQTTDEEVIALLRLRRQELSGKEANA